MYNIKMATRKVMVGNVAVGGGAPVSVQSMTNTKTVDVEATLVQIRALATAGCEIVRCAVPDTQSAAAMRSITGSSPIPVVADIHYDYRLAIQSAQNGAAAVRINPGNIGSEKGVAELCAAVKDLKIPVRVGVNGGSLEPNTTMAQSALRHAEILRKHGVEDIVLSVKSSNVRETVEANRVLHRECGYPLHLGLTEAGTQSSGLIKSAAAIGALLLEGIGDTIRVSLSGDPVPEIAAGIGILRAVGLRRDYVEVIACPTCARSEIDVAAWAESIERMSAHIKKPLKIAVMGCAVNGLGEGAHADVGIAGGKHKSVLFKAGKKVGVTANENAFAELLKLCNF